MSRGGESDGEVSSGSSELAAAAASEAQSGVAPPGLSQSGAATACVLETDVRSPGHRQRDGCRDAPPGLCRAEKTAELSSARRPQGKVAAKLRWRNDTFYDDYLHRGAVEPGEFGVMVDVPYGPC